MKVLFFVAACLAWRCALGAERRSVSVRLPRSSKMMPVPPTMLAETLHLGDRSGFREKNRVRTAKGHDRTVMCQTIDGLDVIGADDVVVELSEQGFATGAVSGTVAYNVQQDIQDSNACHRSKDELMAAGRKYLVDNHMLPADDATEEEDILVRKKVFFDGDEGRARLVYELVFLLPVQPTPCRPFFLFDACSEGLDVLIQFDKIHNMTVGRIVRQAEESCDTTPTPTTRPPPTGACPSSKPAVGFGGNQKTGRTEYGDQDPFCLNTQVSSARCTMSSKYAIVIDLEGTPSESGRGPVEFNCAEGYDDPANGAFGVANDAFYFGDSTGALYEEWYGFFALGYSPKLRVHYLPSGSSCYQNAFWNGRDMTFGDGCSSLYPLVSQDVVAHELGHGITDRYSDLYYSEQSGGINEAFSDMSGEVAELYSRGGNDWEVGRELFKGDRALRYFERPSKDGRSIDNADEFRSGMDVHYSSGVFNRAFFQLVTVQGIPLRQAYEIFLQANKAQWGVRTNFVEGACGAKKAAYDLGYDTQKVANAFNEVGISTADCQLSSIQQTVLPDEARHGVMVSTIRNPVFGLDMEPGMTAIISAVGDHQEELTVHVTSDVEGHDVIASGAAPFIFDVTPDTLFFKLTSPTSDDITADVAVESIQSFLK